MFDISWSELLIVGVVALIAIGPKELPGVLRSLGHWMGKVRRMASDFQDQFREAMREAEVADLKRQFDEASAKATSAFNNPLDIAQKEVEAAFGTDPSGGDKSAATHAVATADPGAIEPSAGAPSSEAPPSVVPDAPMVSADGTIEIKPDSAKQGGAA
ncbi:MAG: Sec-independent protein translocase protein TatB [Pseudomonadota bacterium]